MELKEILKELVRDFGTQARLARVLRVPPQTLSNWILGHSEEPHGNKTAMVRQIHSLNADGRRQLLDFYLQMEAEEDEIYKAPIMRPSIRRLLRDMKMLQDRAKKGDLTDEEADRIHELLAQHLGETGQG